MTALLLGVLMQKSFQQNSGMLRQTKLVIFSQTASLLLMNAAGRVSVSPAEITLNTGNMCPLWVGEHNKPDRQTYIGRQRGKLASVIWIFRGQMLNTTTGEFEIELFFKYVHYVLKIRVTVKKKKNAAMAAFLLFQRWSLRYCMSLEPGCSNRVIVV